MTVLGIVILNYNTWDETIRCVESIKEYTTVPSRIYLVDNQSPVRALDFQTEKLKELNVEIIYNSVNSGYAAGNNVGLKKAYEDGCDQFLISNSDVIITDSSIDRLSSFALRDHNIGVVGPLIYDLNGKRQTIHMLSKLTAWGKINNMMLSTPLRGLFSKFEKSFIMREKPENPLKVFGVSGCCFLVSKECYEKVFPFDEHTFLYEEEYILGCRMEEAGIDAYILPTASVIHAEAISTGGMGAFSYNCLIESEQYYLKEYIHSTYIMRQVIKMLRKINWYLIYKRLKRG